jgi:hypothetical protein
MQSTHATDRTTVSAGALELWLPGLFDGMLRGSAAYAPRARRP